MYDVDGSFLNVPKMSPIDRDGAEYFVGRDFTFRRYDLGPIRLDAAGTQAFKICQYRDRYGRYVILLLTPHDRLWKEI